MALLVFSLSYATAFAETATIANFPYYNFKVRACACRSLLGEPFFGSPLSAAHNRVPTVWMWGDAACCSWASTTLAMCLLQQASDMPCACVQDRSKMYSVGSFFYAIYFFVSFPMFFLLDEDARRRSTVWDAAKEALAASMAVTILLDLWRISLGPIVDLPVDHKGLPWLS